MTLIGNVYVQASDPGAVGFGYQWSDSSTGNIYVRNASNTAWKLVGNANQDNLGLAPKSGFDATGAITGVSGWAPVDSPDFTTAASLEGISLATSNDLTALRSSLLASIETLVAEQVAVYANSQQSVESSAVAVGAGILDFTSAPTVAQTIPRPVFASDNFTATYSQCKWIVSRINFTTVQNNVSGGTDTWYYYEDGGVNVISDVTALTEPKFCCYWKNSGFGTPVGCQVGYIIIGLRS